MKPIPLLIRNAFSLVELLVVIAIIAVLIALLIPAIQKARASAANAQCVNNMKQMGLGLQQHHDVHGYFPYLNSVPWVIPPGKPRFFGWKSWLTQILPYIEQDDVQKQLQSTEEFFKATPTFISVFLCPSDPRENAGGTYPWRVFDDGINQFLNLELAMTSYQGIRGKSGKDWPAMGFDEQGVFAWRDADNAALATGVRMSQISDGLSNTIMVGERPPAPDNSTGWWWSADSLWAIMEGPPLRWSFTDSKGNGKGTPCPAQAYFSPGDLTDYCHTSHFWSFHPGGGNWLLCDGSVRFMPYSAATTVIPAMATIAGGEEIPPFE